jgi:hypothetical protein
LGAILHAWVGALGAAPKVLCTILELSRIKSIDSLAVVLERVLQLVKSDLTAILEVACSNYKVDFAATDQRAGELSAVVEVIWQQIRCVS